MESGNLNNVFENTKLFNLSDYLDTYILNTIIKTNQLIIDKEYYTLNYNQIKHLCNIQFDFNSINFDISVNKLTDYLRLLVLSENNYIIEQKCDNFNINKLEIENCFFNLYTVKKLHNKNFNFNLIPNIENNNYQIIEYLINNNLYNFFNRDKYEVIKNCNKNTFKFFINYLNINVYDEYNGYTLYGVISDSIHSNTTDDKFKILYQDYNLLINDNDICTKSGDICFFIIYYYDIQNIHKFNQNSLYILLTNYMGDISMTDFPHNESIVNKYIQIFDLVHNLDINFLVPILNFSNIIKINKTIFNKIINKINLNLLNDVNTLKINLQVKELFIFYCLYLKYYNNNIVNFTKDIFDYKDMEIIKQEVLYSFDPIKVNGYKSIKTFFD